MSLPCTNDLNVKYHWNNTLKIRLIWLLIIIYWIKLTLMGIRLHTKKKYGHTSHLNFHMYKHFLLSGVKHSTKNNMNLNKRCKLTPISSWLKFLNQEKNLNSKTIIKAYFRWTYALIHPNRKMFLPYGQMYYYCFLSYLCDTMHEWIFNDKHSNFQWE